MTTSRMIASSTAADGRGGSRGLPHPSAVQARLPGRIRLPMVALAVTMIAVAVLGSILLYQAGTHQRQVLALAVTVPQGQQITAADLRTTSIAGGARLATEPVSAEDKVIGDYAVSTLAADSLLTAADLTPAQVPAPGQILVPVQVKQGQLPARGVTPGEAILITPVPGAQAGATQQAELVQPVQATLQEISQPDTNGMVTADLLVADQYATQVAAQASTGDIAILVAPQGQRG